MIGIQQIVVLLRNDHGADAQDGGLKRPTTVTYPLGKFSFDM
jgi:hypothetical protein